MCWAMFYYYYFWRLKHFNFFLVANDKQEKIFLLLKWVKNCSPISQRAKKGVTYKYGTKNTFFWNTSMSVKFLHNIDN